MSHPLALTVRELRRTAGLNQTAFGSRLGLSQSQVSDLERGVVSVPPMLEHIVTCDLCRAHFLTDGALLGKSDSGRNHHQPTPP